MGIENEIKTVISKCLKENYNKSNSRIERKIYGFITANKELDSKAISGNSNIIIVSI